jgi:predicted transcriptional regulator
VEKLQELLFELSSSERMGIMRLLQDESLKLSDLSKKRRLTNPEALRQLRRLCDVGLVQREPSGLYMISHYGELVLSLLEGVDFVARNQDYFSKYDTSFLPYEYINRFGELLSSSIGAEPFKVLEKTQNVLKEAKEFVWIISNQNFALYLPTMMEKLESGIDFRLIFPESVYPPESRALIPSNTPGMHKRILSEVNVRLVVTDKYSGFGLPLRENMTDYRAIMGDDSRFHKWCKDLFTYYWEKSRPHIPYREKGS